MPKIPAPIADENSQAVVAYRLTKVEEAVQAGFKEHNQKLETLVNGFATKEELKSVEAVIAQNDKASNTRISSLESDRRWIVRTILFGVVAAILSVIGIGYKVIN